jgi:hypothetical protein
MASNGLIHGQMIEVRREIHRTKEATAHPSLDRNPKSKIENPK